MKIINQTIGTEGAQLWGYLHEQSPSWPAYAHRPCVLVCPGGGYGFCSDREMDPVTMEFLAQGYQVFLLLYSTGEKARDYQPLREVSEAIATIRDNCEMWGVDPNRVAVCGFSAGAHLACSSALLRHVPAVAQYAQKSRPDAMILCYPVISSGEFAHEGSFENLTGQPRGPRWEAFSLDKFVTRDCPPCFLWHTVDDELVPVQNTLLFMNALQKNGVSYECHLYPTGAHGLSMCTGEVCRPGAQVDPHPRTWFPLCCQWLAGIFDFQR